MGASLEFRHVDVFTAVPFAGNGLIVLFGGRASIGADALISVTAELRQFELILADCREITVRSSRTPGYFEAAMNQGRPTLGLPLADQDAAAFASALGLGRDDLHRLPMQVVSTGLPYLIVPVSSGLDRARITVGDFEERLAKTGAKFVYVFDPDRREGRSWDKRRRG